MFFSSIVSLNIYNAVRKGKGLNEQHDQNIIHSPVIPRGIIIIIIMKISSNYYNYENIIHNSLILSGITRIIIAE